jgi:hypothetical protein
MGTSLSFFHENSRVARAMEGLIASVPVDKTSQMSTGGRYRDFARGDTCAHVGPGTMWLDQKNFSLRWRG